MGGRVLVNTWIVEREEGGVSNRPLVGGLRMMVGVGLCEALCPNCCGLEQWCIWVQENGQLGSYAFTPSCGECYLRC